METTAQERYIAAWDAHLDEISKIKWNLISDDDKYVAVDEAVSKLKELVRIAAQNVKTIKK